MAVFSNTVLTNQSKQALKMLLIDKVQQIPGVSHTPWPERDDGFSTLHFQNKEIGHFHNFQEIDLRLGRKLIKAEGLTHYSDSNTPPTQIYTPTFMDTRFAKNE